MHDSIVLLRGSSHQVLSIALGLTCASVAGGCSSYYPLGSSFEKHQDLLGDDAAAASPGVDFQFSGALDQPSFSTDIDYDLVNRMISVGDLDGDGHDDRASVVHDFNTATVFVHLWYGGARPTGPTEIGEFVQSDAQLTLSSTPTEQSLPFPFFEIARGGDVNGDGHAELLVRALFCEDPTSPAGVHLIYGGPERVVGSVPLASVASAFVPLPNASELYRCGAGTAVAAGDLDGDGLDDMLITNAIASEGFGAPAAPDGGLYIFYGREQPFSGDVILGEADAFVRAIPELGVLAVGDVNGDGLADLVTKHAHGQIEGTFFLAGRTPRLSGSHQLEAVSTFLEGAFPSLPAGFEGPPGDLDGDGVHDLLLQDEELTAHMFYGAPGLFAAGIDFDAADARIDLRPFEPELSVVGLLQMPQIVADRDGDGDGELLVPFVSGAGPLYWFHQDVALVSGSRQRLAGDVRIPREQIIAQRPDGLHADPYRSVQTIIPVGDLDADGVADLLTTSSDPISEAPVTSLHVHYGTGGTARLSPIR